MVSSAQLRIRNFLFVNNSDGQIFIKNLIWRIGSVAGNKLVRLLVILLAARLLGPQQFGYYNYLFSLATLAFIFSDWGISLLVVRGLQQKDTEAGPLVATGLAMRAAVSLLGVVATVVIVSLTVRGALPLALLLGGTLLWVGLKDVASAVLIGWRRAELEFAVSVVDSAVLLVLCGAIVWSHRTAVGLASAYVLTAALTTVVALWLASRTMRLRIGMVRSSVFKFFIRDGFPLSLFGILGFVFFSTDQLFIKHFYGYVAVGHYALASKIVLASLALPTLVLSVLFPLLCGLISEPQRMRQWLARSLFGFIGGSVFFAAIGTWLAPLMISRVYGASYTPAVHVVQLLLWMIVPLFATMLLDHVLIAYNRQKQNFYLTAIAAVINGVLNYLWVPHYGIDGAVYASLVAQTVNFILTGWYVYRLIRT